MELVQPSLSLFHPESSPTSPLLSIANNNLDLVLGLVNRVNRGEEVSLAGELEPTCG